MSSETEPSIIAPDGRPARQVKADNCPSCRAGRERRVLSGGFGEPHDVCGQCGHEFQERTL